MIRITRRRIAEAYESFFQKDGTRSTERSLSGARVDAITPVFDVGRPEAVARRGLFGEQGKDTDFDLLDTLDGYENGLYRIDFFNVILYSESSPAAYLEFDLKYESPPISGTVTKITLAEISALDDNIEIGPARKIDPDTGDPTTRSWALDYGRMPLEGIWDSSEVEITINFTSFNLADTYSILLAYTSVPQGTEMPNV